MDFTKLTKTLTDAKAEGEANHNAAVKRIVAQGLVYRDADGNLVTVPQD